MSSFSKNIAVVVSALFISYASNAQAISTNYEDQKKRAVKMEFFSPLTGNTTIGYESYIRDWLSWEIKVGAIGIGTDNADANPSGVLIKVGPKFKLNPDFVTDDLKGSHLLSGKYIRPEIVFSQYSEDVQVDIGNGAFSDERRDITSIAFLVTYGRQYVLADVMTLDYHIGVGYGYDSSEDGKYNYSHSNGAPDFPIAVTAGFTIGFLLK